MKNDSGFTLIELMVTLALAVILLTLAIPNLRTMIQNNRLVTAANSLVGDINLARSEAIKRGESVRIVANAGGWNKGWTVEVAGSGTDIKVAGAIKDNVTITAAGGVTTITYGSNGAASAADTFSVCDDRTNETGKQISIALTGRVATNSYTCP